MKVLVACEESQEVCKAFRELGHEAYSCDIKEPSGGHPEWHILCDALKAVKGGSVNTLDGQVHEICKWDLLIAHPPCTYLTVTGNRWFNEEKYGEKAVRRLQLREEAAAFFMSFANAPCDKIAIENPVGVMSSEWRKPNQIIHPWMFGDMASKQTCLWLKGLPNLTPTVTEKPEFEYHEWVDKRTGKKKRMEKWMYDIRCISDRTKRAEMASKTFPGIAKAMAEQWSGERRKNAY